MANEIRVISVTDQTGFSSVDTGTVRKAEQEFWVELSGTGPRDVILEIIKGIKTVPRQYEVAHFDKFLIALPVKYSQHKELPNLWIVNVSWSSITGIQDTVRDPVDMPALIETGTYFEQDNPDVDFVGKPVVNTAGEPIDWPFQKGYTMFTVRKNYGEYPKEFARKRDFVNRDKVKIYGVEYQPYELFCPEVNISSLQWRNSFPFFAFEAKIYVNDRKDSKDNVIGWKKQKRNTGYHERIFQGFKADFDTSPEPIIYKSIADAKKNNVTSDHLVPVYAFKAITLGRLGSLQYPSSPVLLTPFGTAFREKIAGDKQKAIDQVNATVVLPLQKRYLLKQIELGNYPGTGAVLGQKLDGEPQKTSGITKEQWEQAIVEMQFYNLVDFATTFPLDAQDIPKDFRSGQIA